MRKTPFMVEKAEVRFLLGREGGLGGGGMCLKCHTYRHKYTGTIHFCLITTNYYVSVQWAEIRWRSSLFLNHLRVFVERRK